MARAVCVAVQPALVVLRALCKIQYPKREAVADSHQSPAVVTSAHSTRQTMTTLFA